MSESVWTKPFLLEMNIADIISQQSKVGVNFKKRDAAWNIHRLSERIIDIDKVLVPLLPKMLNVGSEYKKPFLISGKLAKYPGIYAETAGLTREEIGGPFTAVWYTPFDTGKSARVKLYMLDNGWIPTEWNIKKMPMKIWTYRKRLERNGFNKFMEMLPPEERQYYNDLLEGYIDTHFRGKSVNYMKAYLSALNFPKNGKPPTFAMIKKKLLLTQFWPASPKITEDSFESVSEESGQALHLLKERMVWSHRRSMIEGLVKQIRDDGHLEGRANPCATPTARMRHSIVVNIPASGAPFGRECRSMFVGFEDKTILKPTILKKAIDKEFLVPGTNLYFEMDGKKKVFHRYRDYIPAGRQVFVGYDGAGLELRMLCHFMIKECQDMLDEANAACDSDKAKRAQSGLDSALIYRQVLLEGDIHSHNQKLAGLPTRKAAKSFIYGFNYGAGDAKLGELVNGGKEEGAKIRETFLRENPCIAILIERMQAKGRAGYLIGLDGRHLYLRTDDDGAPQVHKALNLLLQSAGAIVMKYAMCFLRNDVKRSGIRAAKVLDIHDEGQWSCHPDDREDLMRFMSGCVRRAGEFLDMKCPLASDAMVGSSWYATH